GPVGIVPLGAVTIACIGLLYLPDRYEASQDHRRAMDGLVAAIQPHVDGEKCLWVFDGPTALYTATGSCLPTRLIYPDHLNNALERDALEVRQIDEVRRIMGERPPIVVTADRAFTLQNQDTLGYVTDTLPKGYAVIAEERIHDRGIEVWLRRDLLPSN
ncbi:MAG: hypothetical protein VXX26_05435, partial [Pseudomonadota bacterium]|nr:hypothetical protein [Pseudomonadota bacterium]